MAKEDKVARRVRELCQVHGLSVNALAEKSKISPSTIHNILKGTDERNTRISSIFKICCGFGISLAEFFSDDMFLE